MLQRALLYQILISAALSSRGLRNTVSTAFGKQTISKKITAETLPVVRGTNHKIELTVYYETLCPASVDFFVTQLKPTVKRLEAHLDVHLIPYGHAKTYRSRGRYFFDCQHGRRECYVNMVHACAIDVLRNNTHSIFFNSCLMQYISYQSTYDYIVSVLRWTYRSRGRYFFDCQHGRRECYVNMVHACAIDVLRNNTHSIFFNSCLMQYISYQSTYDYIVSVLRWCGYRENVRIAEIWKCVKSSRGNIILKKYGDVTHELNPLYVPYLMINGSRHHQDEASSDLLGTVCRILNPKPKACRS